MRMSVFSAAFAAAVLMSASGPAAAKLPTFSGDCPGNIHVDANSHGVVRINGERARVRKSNDNYYEARRGGITISIARDPSGLLLSYTLKGGANGICTVASEEIAAPAASTGMPSEDEQACLLAVTQQTSNGDVILLKTETSEANTAVIVGVGENRAKWRCLSKNGIVDEVMSLTDEGAL